MVSDKHTGQERQYPPDASVAEDEFHQATRDADNFEDVRWMVWLFDALDDQEWENALWRASVLHQKGYTELVTTVDRHFGRWIDE